MNKTPYQFRYYGEQTQAEKEKNYPLTLTKEQLTTSNIFAIYKKYFITQIGIQGTPGLQFKLNNSKNWIEIGKTGIYELDLTDIGHIDNICFKDNDALNFRNPETKNSFLFIDILYKGNNEGGKTQ